MGISKIIMIIMAVFFVLGALDRLLGNKLGMGGEFERAFGLMGPSRWIHGACTGDRKSA